MIDRLSKNECTKKEKNCRKTFLQEQNWMYLMQQNKNTQVQK